MSGIFLSIICTLSPVKWVEHWVDMKGWKLLKPWCGRKSSEDESSEHSQGFMSDMMKSCPRNQPSLLSHSEHAERPGATHLDVKPRGEAEADVGPMEGWQQEELAGITEGKQNRSLCFWMTWALWDVPSLPSSRQRETPPYTARFHTAHYWRVLECEIISAAHAADSDMTNGWRRRKKGWHALKIINHIPISNRIMWSAWGFGCHRSSTLQGSNDTQLQAVGTVTWRTGREKSPKNQLWLNPFFQFLFSDFPRSLDASFLTIFVNSSQQFGTGVFHSLATVMLCAEPKVAQG